MPEIFVWFKFLLSRWSSYPMQQVACSVNKLISLNSNEIALLDKIIILKTSVILSFINVVYFHTHLELLILALCLEEDLQN